MAQAVNLVFIGQAETFMQDKEGVIYFEFPAGSTPNKGDLIM